jgi:3-methyladenine DNA glycosylase/8-oxoguanine DNA glycosylase
MIDEEVIKALECCKKHGYNFEECERCPYGGQCYTDDVNLCQDVLDLINRQKAEIKELEAKCDRQYEQAEADIRANIADGGTSCHWCMDKHRAEAIKEFAERLKERAYTSSDWSHGEHPQVVELEDINEIVEELTGKGDNNGQKEN